MVGYLTLGQVIIVCNQKNQPLPESTPNIKTSRCFKKFDPVNFRNDIAMAPWYLFEAESDPNNAWAIWKQIFEYVADMYSHAPLKRKRD